MTTLTMSPTLGDLLKFELNGSYSRETVTLTPSTSPSTAERKLLRSCIHPIASVARASALIDDHPMSSQVSDATCRATTGASPPTHVIGDSS